MKRKSVSVRAWWQSVSGSKFAFICMGLIPLFVAYFLFSLYPIFQALRFSFYKYNMIGLQKFTGLDNFRRVLRDELFIKSLGNTFYYILGTVGLGVFLSLMAAIFINSFRRGRASSFLCIAFFLPIAASGVVGGILGRWITGYDSGILNTIIGYFGIPRVNWLVNPLATMPFLICLSIWKGMGFNVIIFLAGLQGISRDIYEAASIDGANWWKKIRYITIPLIEPITLVLVITGIIGATQMFDLVYVMTEGGPLHTTRVIFYHIYQTAFFYMRMGYALMMNLVVFIILFVFTLAQFRAMKKKWKI